VSQCCDRPIVRLALLAALAAALGLTGCGRKGPLDPPPAASLAGDQAAQKSTPASIDASGRPRAAPGPKKRIPLDVLLN
jgi:predicted small lipoprotein YifL